MLPARDSAAVLIVEDDQSVRDILIELFALDGTDVTAVATLTRRSAHQAVRRTSSSSPVSTSLASVMVDCR
jgi:CheY-like chemotaxis protein